MRFEGVGVRYPGADRDAIAEATLDLEPGMFAVLLGPSGCGKSTLVRTANRLVPPARGRVEIDGVDIATVDAVALRRSIGYVIQAVGLFPHMSVAENIAVVPRLLGWPSQRIAHRVDELLELVRLDPARYRTCRPRELSGGQAQRVGVARALAGEPRLLLMDEPFGAVDALVRASLQDEIVSIVRRLGTTVLFVTHDVDEALRIADCLAILHEGRIVQAAPPLEVLVHPCSEYVRALLDTDDTIRRLRLMSARQAARRRLPDDPANCPTLAPDATLYDALGRLLDGALALRVEEDEHDLGMLDLAAIRRALAKGAS
ncbi:MAG: ABC transporter ATP-binding protein [Vulcanimicrobiaceae bacterium]